VRSAIRGVRESNNATLLATSTMSFARCDGPGRGEGKTLTNRKKHKGIAEADAKAALAAMMPHSVPAYVLTKPLLNVHEASDKERRPKYLLTDWEGFLSHTARPKRTFAAAVRTRIRRRSFTVGVVSR
jgi:hypothetical protein